MNQTQARSSPKRIHEPNIIHNPLTWFGIWTPQGWRVHRKRFGRAERLSIMLSGDGKTTFFPGALRDPASGQIDWHDDLHQADDPFTDGGVYPCDPRVEYSIGQPRWAVSHTLMCYPVADHNLHTHEYTWDMETGDLRTHFRRHVALEEARTDDRDGLTVRVRHNPISQTIEGDVHYAMNNSAVRGVWASPQKTGQNFYAQRSVELVRMRNAVYGKPAHSPVVQCHGIWRVDANDSLDKLDRQRLIEEMHISLDEPKIGMIRPAYERVLSRVYESEVQVTGCEDAVVDDEFVQEIRRRAGAKFEFVRVGYASSGAVGSDAVGYAGYDPGFDLNSDGVIDERDGNLAARHLGRRVRPNLYRSGYFGGDWISTGVLLAPEHSPGIPVVVDYSWGGGYDAEAGMIRLLQTPGPGRPVWVEYFYDEPAAAGENNIRLHLYRET